MNTMTTRTLARGPLRVEMEPTPTSKSDDTRVLTLAEVAQDLESLNEDQIDIEERSYEAVLDVCTDDNVRQGAAWLETLASNGDAVAAAFLAQTLFDGMDGVPRDPSRALHWATKAIEGNHPQGYRVLADIYNEGKAVPLNLELVVENSQKAALYGDLASQHRMALVFKSGVPPKWPVNYAESYRWALLAIANNHSWLVGTESLTPPNLPYENLREAASTLRAELERKLTPEQRARVQRQASEWKPLEFSPSTIRGALKIHMDIFKSLLRAEPPVKSNSK